MYIAYAPIYCHPLPEGHRFPMDKYELIPQQLLHEGTITENEIHAPGSADEAVVLLTHEADYVNRLKQGQLTASEVRRTGFPWSAALVKREYIITQGTINCALHALEHGVALNVAGGTHHAFANRGEGFCLLNDMAVAANYLLQEKLVKQILIIDLDVHQGNGTAKIFEGRKEVFTFSMHGGHNYPFIKEQSDLDIPLKDGTGDEEYLETLRTQLAVLHKKVQPDFVFYLSGVDVLATDKFGKLKLTREGCLRRDEMAFQFCKTNSLPCAVAMGGGYSPHIKDIVEAHCNTFRLAGKI